MATWDHLLDSSFESPDGEPMLDGLVPASRTTGAAALLVMMVWDGAGRNVLAQWPDAWPNLAELRAEGAWYEQATVGSSPTSSAQIHATLGTAAFPKHHGVPGHTVRIDGELVSPWKDGPFELELETFGDHFDQERGNDPLVGMSGSVPIQMGMMSRGAYAEGGDKDLAVLRTPGQGIIEGLLGAEGKAWNIPEQYSEWYEFPSYVNDFPKLASYFDDVDLDARDGERDGMWHGHPYEQSEELLNGFHTPARVPYQTRLIEEVITREGFGADETTDLFFINYKLIDTLGHLYGIEDETMRDAVETQDEYLAPFIDFLNEEVGQGSWAMVLTADHGSLESTEATGAFQISAERLHSSIQERFDGDDDDVTVIDQVKQTEIFMNVEELEEQGHTLDAVSRFIMNLRQSQLQIPGLPVSDPDAKVFQAAFPAEALLALPCLSDELVPDPLDPPVPGAAVVVQVAHRAAPGLHAPVLAVPAVVPPPALDPPSADHVGHLVPPGPPPERGWASRRRAPPRRPRRSVWSPRWSPSSPPVPFPPLERMFDGPLTVLRGPAAVKAGDEAPPRG